MSPRIQKPKSEDAINARYAELRDQRTVVDDPTFSTFAEGMMPLPIDTEREADGILTSRARLRKHNTFTVQPADRPYLKKACELGVAKAKAATKACAVAECTQGAHESQTLEGYCDENIIRIDAVVGTELELATNGRLAMLTGLRIYAGEVEKNSEKALTLFVDESGFEDVAARLARLLRLFNVEHPELALDDGESDDPYADDESRDPDADVVTITLDANGSFATVVDTELDVAPAGDADE